MAQKQLTYPRMFNASWTEKDEAVLLDLLRRKIEEMRFEISKSDSPYVKSRLREKRKEYKQLLEKVEAGEYNSNILAAEVAAFKVNEFAQKSGDKKTTKAGKYVDSYEDVNFDFETYFRKKRYYGSFIAVVNILVTLSLLIFMLISVIFPKQDLSVIIADQRISATSIASFKLNDDNDFLVYNNGKWPQGTFSNPENTLAYGDIYTDTEGNQPDSVYLYKDLGMNTIDITVADIYKAFFRTPMMAKTKIDVIENLEGMTGGSWYYYRFMMDREEELKIVRGEDGKYDPVVIVQSFSTYGLIALFIIALFLMLAEIVINIVRLFTYTSRRVHWIPILIFFCLSLVTICPILSDIGSLDTATMQSVFVGYMTPSWSQFLESDAMIHFNFAWVGEFGAFLTIGIYAIFFRNRKAKLVTFIPKGNKPHTFKGQMYPTKPGRIPQEFIEPNNKKTQKNKGVNPYLYQ